MSMSKKMHFSNSVSKSVMVAYMSNPTKPSLLATNLTGEWDKTLMSAAGQCPSGVWFSAV